MKEKPVYVKRVTLELFRTSLIKAVVILETGIWTFWDEKSRFQEDSLKSANF